MNNKKISKDILLVIISNIIKMGASVLTILIIPKLFTVQDYGYYKLFLLYLSYTAMLHFGIIDGIYLFFAGKKYEELPVNKIRTYTKFIFIQQIFVTLILMLISLFFDGDKRLIILFVSANVLLINMTGFFQQISQITERFKEFAFRNIINAILNISIIFLFFYFEITSYILFITLITVINVITLIWYLWTYKDLVIGVSENLKISSNEIKYFFKIGIPLLLSNIIVIFMSNIPKQLVELFYPIEKYPTIFSEFSFAFTLLGFTSVFLSAVGIVIFPILKKNNFETLKKVYFNLSSLLIVAIFFALCMYVPVEIIVTKYLPEYSNSIIVFFVICPSIVFTSLVTIIQQNYYKTLNKNKVFLIKGIIVLLFMTITIILSYFFISKSIIFIAYIYTLFILIWYIINEIYLVKKLNLFFHKNYLYTLVMIILFLGIYFISNIYFKMLYYIIAVLFISMFFYHKDLLTTIKKLRTENKE